ncbi:MAG: DUF2336 domain-containing protein [Caulobacteraceae bacterium]|nr:DUF2336 domain-containing protein [Caulobacteraceae bacterium]
MTLVRKRPQRERDGLLAALGELGATEPAFARDKVRATLEPLFLDLVTHAELELRRRLAERLAGSAWAPPGVIRFLAADDIEVARPVIAESPLLQDADLLKLLAEASAEHRIEVAGRHGLAEPVAAAIIAAAEPAVLTALAANVSAAISEADMAALVEASRPIVGLRAPLSRHPKLSDSMARRLYIWVGDQLRQAIAERFEVDPAELERQIEDAVGEAVAVHPTVELIESERKLVEKLAAARQLRSGYLLRALREGRLVLFEAALVELSGFSAEAIKQAGEAPSPDLLALACLAVGVDRSAFPTILELVRDLNQGRPGGGEDGARTAAAIFDAYAPQTAKATFARLAGEV